MKIRILFTLFVLTASAILFWNASGGPAAVQQADRTRSPLSNNSSCATCHNSGNFSPGLNVQLLDGEMAVTSYEPGKTYTLSVAITGADDAGGYGFQSVLLYGENDLNAGTFGSAPTGIQLTPLNERMYAEHSSRSDTSVFTIDWTAPEMGVGDIRVYASGNAANANGSVTGDQGAFLASPVVLTEASTSHTEDRLLTFDAIQVSPNPTRSGIFLKLENSRPGPYTLRLLNAVGQTLQEESLNLIIGAQTHWVDLSQEPEGLYFIQLSNGQQFLTKKILKQ